MSDSASERSEPLVPARSISGFPEYLPEVHRLERHWIDTFRSIFESYGYTPIETPSVEEVEVLSAKGEIDKEIYGISRIAGGADDKEARLALHYDLTVPLARYVAQHYGDLVFPFKRYQIQRVWRGERPQEGRYREFTQCDIDVIDNNSVSTYFDSEAPIVVIKAFERLGVGPVSFHLNNRKILSGFYQGLGITDPVAAIRIVDKIDKLPKETIHDLLVQEAGVEPATAERCLRLAEIKTDDDSFVGRVRELGVTSALLDEGLEELQRVMSSVLAQRGENCRPCADLSIARGFDYYTGTIYEAQFVDYPEYSSICAGGRYDNLVGSFTRRKLPGVGISVGLTRIFTKLLKENRLDFGATCPTDVLVANLPGATHDPLEAVADSLRSRGVNVEVFPEEAKLKAQFRYASRKQIPFVWLTESRTTPGAHEVKDMAEGTQSEADAKDWLPPRLR